MCDLCHGQHASSMHLCTLCGTLGHCSSNCFRFQVESEGWPDRRKTMYHMTDQAAAEKILLSRCMLPGTFGMFGAGIYFCERKEDCLKKARRHGVTLRCLVRLGRSLICRKKNTQLNMEWVQRYVVALSVVRL